MDARLTALKLFLDELDTPSNIETVDDRKRVQKAVYLGQLSGVDLGYRFGWYLMGPYSPSLTRDYYTLATEIESGDREYEDKALQPSLLARLRKVQTLLAPPAEVDLPQEGWLELVSSVHYLREITKLSRDKALARLAEEKPALVKFVDQAEGKLREVGLLQ
jgi:uncharacterized protein YwgA